mmetsp:Transcript_68144/g.160395  ORF Transcript_68144/g.160395 Transcript_68144/m.160395 type:complete len:204 (+) Transcript_68144:207-818(+)
MQALLKPAAVVRVMPVLACQTQAVGQLAVHILQVEACQAFSRVRDVDVAETSGSKAPETGSKDALVKDAVVKDAVATAVLVVLAVAAAAAAEAAAATLIQIVDAVGTAVATPWPTAAAIPAPIVAASSAAIAVAINLETAAIHVPLPVADGAKDVPMAGSGTGNSKSAMSPGTQEGPEQNGQTGLSPPAGTDGVRPNFMRQSV